MQHEQGCALAISFIIHLKAPGIEVMAGGRVVAIGDGGLGLRQL